MCPLKEGHVVSGPLFDEPMRVEVVRERGPETWDVGLVGLKSQRYRSVTLTPAEIAALTILDTCYDYSGDGQLLRLGMQAYSLGIAFEFDPYFGLSISKVDPLPHQLEAVYDYLLKLARVRFLLADDAGAGKTIMAGLLIRELKLRGLADRILVVCPANLTFQWQRELSDKFGEQFRVHRGAEIRDQYGMNLWLDEHQVITSLDLAKRGEILKGLRQAHWHLVIVDEAHRMSASDESHKSLRYKLGEILRDSSDHILLLTATPHKGDPVNFTLFLQLLDEDAFADVRSIRLAMEQRKAPFYLRRTKEAMVYFPERMQDGTWAAKPIFTKRTTNTADFKMDGAEFELYSDVSTFVKDQSRRAAEQDENPRARAVGFLMSLYQRRLASSAFAMRRSLENRIDRLEDLLNRREELARQTQVEIPDLEDVEEMGDVEMDKLEEKLNSIALTADPHKIREEIQELKELASRAKDIEEKEAEAKLSRLKDLLHTQGFFDQSDERLLIFTEFKDTLDYLVGRLKSWGFKVGYIHGGMRPGSRDDKGSRVYVEQQFREGAIQVLVATEAAGEGINLQVCHILFNYDIPWNPNRLEQRMGRIHRYGQRKDCLIFNFVASNTVEGQVLNRLLLKLQEIRNALDDDSVFNVVGEVLPASHIERVLRDYYAGKFGEPELEDRLLKNVNEGRFREICQNALEGLASKRLNLEMLIERKALAQERRIVPETISRFIREAAPCAHLDVKFISSLPYTFDPGRTPSGLEAYEREEDWKLPKLLSKYPRCSTDRETAEKNVLEWVTPGHPLFEALRRHAFSEAQASLSKGACFYSIQYEKPARIDFYRARVVDGLGNHIHERIFAVELAEDEQPALREPGVLGDFKPANPPDQLPPIASAQEETQWVQVHALRPFLEETRKERLAEVDRIAHHVEVSLTELLGKVDVEIGKASEDLQKKLQGAEGRLAQAEERAKALQERRDRRMKQLVQERSLTLQAVERITSVLVLPHPEREAPDVRGMRPNPETEATAMRVVIEYEQSQGRKVDDVHEKNLGYDITSVNTTTGELRLIEVKGLAGDTGTIVLTPNEIRVAQDRRDCYWLYIVTNCGTEPTMQEPVRDPAQFRWREVSKVQHYLMDLMDVKAMTKQTVSPDKKTSKEDDSDHE
jgi:superfamily II DNA or RNA helicase